MSIFSRVRARSRSRVLDHRPSESPPVRRLPSVAPSARSRGGGGSGCDHADGKPAACLGRGEVHWEVVARGCPPRHCSGRVRSERCLRNNVKDGTPGGGHMPAGPDANPTLRVDGMAAILHLGQGLGWRRRQVMARTSSKRSRASVAPRRSIEFDRESSRMWVSTSLADA